MAEATGVYLDANVFVYALEGEPDIAQPAQDLLFALRSGKARAITSDLTLAEVLVKPERLRLTRLKREYLNLLLFSRAIELLSVSRSILLESTRYQARVHPDKPDPSEGKRNFLPDAIHVVTAIQANASFFVSRDMRLRLPVGMTRVAPDAADIHGLIERLQ